MSEPAIQLEYATPMPKRKWRERRRGKPVLEFIALGVDAILYSFMAIFAISLCSGLLSLLIGGPLAGALNVLTGIVLIPSLAAAAVSIRRRRSAAIIGYLHQAVRLNQPFNRVLSAAARSENARTARRLIALRDDLAAGISLSDALAGAVPEVPIRTIGLIDFACKAGQLGPTLHRLVEEDLDASRKTRNDQAFAAWYPFLMIVLWTVNVSVFCIFIAPKFRQILHDFRIPLPPIFLFVDSLGDYVWILGAITAVIMLACLGWQLRKMLRMPPPVWILARVRGWMAWHLPVLRSFVRDRNISDLCTCLADPFELQYPLDTALTRVAAIELNSVLRKRVLNWVTFVQNGMAPAEAARSARMPRLLVGLLATTRDPQGMIGVLRFVSRFYIDRSTVRRETLRAAVIPVFTILMGVAVALVALSIFIPMEQMLSAMAPGF